MFIPLPDKQYSCKEDPRQTFITQVLKDINANVLNVWHELCNINFFAVNGRHFNVQGYGVLSDLIEKDFERWATLD